MWVSLSPVDDMVASEDEGEEDLIVSADELGLDAELDDTPSDRFLHDERLVETRAKWKVNEKDSGSPEFQIAGMTERINYLTQHMQQHPKDFSTRRGLVALVNKRRRLLNYLSQENANRYTEIVTALGIRHKAPGRVLSRDQQYARFPPQKKRKEKKF